MKTTLSQGSILRLARKAADSSDQKARSHGLLIIETISDGQIISEFEADAFLQVCRAAGIF